MAIRTELQLFVENKTGTLARICNILAEERVNVLAMAAPLQSGPVHLLVDNPVHAAGVFRERDVKTETRDVLYTVLPNEPGSLAHVARWIAEAGINIDYLYASALEGGPSAAVVIGVKDVQRASSILGI